MLPSELKSQIEGWRVEGSPLFTGLLLSTELPRNAQPYLLNNKINGHLSIILL